MDRSGAEERGWLVRSSEAPAWFKRLWPLLVVGGLVSVCLFIFALIVDSFPARFAAKPWPVVAMIAALAAWRRDDRYARIVMTGLVACLVGDMFLEFRQRFFLQGMIAFLLGHLFYIRAFFTQTRQAAPELAVPFAAWVGWIIVLMLPGLGALKIPVIAYTLVIFAMMWRASVTASALRTWGAWTALVGAVVFGLSDTLIALDRFHEPVSGVRIPIIITYWAGQLLITLSAFCGAPASGSTGDVPGGEPGDDAG